MEKKGVIKYNKQTSSYNQDQTQDKSPLYEKFVRLKIYSPDLELQNVFTNLHLDEIFVNKHPHFVCQICLSFVINPVSCSVCETIFCNHCIVEYSKHNQKICPNRCNLIIKPLNRILRNMLEEIKMDCLFKIKGCSEKLQYDTYIPHINECELGPHMCLAKDCLYVETRSKIISHVKFCEYFEQEEKIDKCKNSSYQVKMAKKLNLNSNAFPSRSSTSASNQVPKNCVYCKNSFKEDILSIHTFICEGQLVICKCCDRKMSLKEFKKHEEKVHSDCSFNKLGQKLEFLEDKLKYNENVLFMQKNEIASLEEKISLIKNQNDKNLISKQKVDSLLVEKNIGIQICDNLLHETKFEKINISLNKFDENLLDLQKSDSDSEDRNIDIDTNLYSKWEFVHMSDKEIFLFEEKSNLSKLFLETNLPIQIENTLAVVNQEQSNMCFYNMDSNKILPNKFYFVELEGEQITCINFIKLQERENNLINSSNEYFVFSTDSGNLLFYKNKNFLNLEFQKKQKVLETSVKYLNNYLIKISSHENCDEIIFLVVGGMYSNLNILDFKTLEKVGELDHRNKSVLSFRYLKFNDENFLISTTKDSLIRVWSHEITKKMNENSKEKDEYIRVFTSKFTFKEFLKGHKDFVWSLEILNNKYLASGSGDKSILVWGLESDSSNPNSNNNSNHNSNSNSNFIFILKNSLSGHKDSVTCLKFWDVSNNAGQYLFSGSFDGEIKLWRMNSQISQISQNQPETITELKFENILSIFPQNTKIKNIFIPFDFKLVSEEKSSKVNCGFKMISDGEAQNLILSNFKINLYN